MSEGSTAPPMFNVQIDGVWRQFPKGTRVIEACEQAGSYVPRYCYHKKLSSPGNCRMCLIEMGMPEKKAVYYSEAVRRGATLVCVTLDDGRLDVAKTVIDAHGSLDINNQAAQWRQGGWQDFGAEADGEVVLVESTYVFEVPNRERLAS